MPPPRWAPCVPGPRPRDGEPPAGEPPSSLRSRSAAPFAFAGTSIRCTSSRSHRNRSASCRRCKDAILDRILSSHLLRVFSETPSQDSRLREGARGAEAFDEVVSFVAGACEVISDPSRADTAFRRPAACRSDGNRRSRPSERCLGAIRRRRRRWHAWPSRSPPPRRPR